MPMALMSHFGAISPCVNIFVRLMSGMCQLIYWCKVKFTEYGLNSLLCMVSLRHAR